ncbi:hypothetical protein [Tahibacter harae]|uniref:Uncharacterized protein n=1 Tax=Tahibacter harae TaxID=2963937 RepID=A0ABT1QZ86_9GAMM|nr:hypothetical protein [Tahibacter harae]MCQ4167606.1 hypothetical protein [Tahibacter harae]
MALDNRVEAYVSHVTRDKKKKTVVVVVPGNGTLHVGDVFLSCYKIPMTMEDIANERPRPPPTDCVDVKLTIVAIDFWGNGVKELPPGITGALYLKGDGMEYVDSKCRLRT